MGVKLRYRETGGSPCQVPGLKGIAVVQELSVECMVLSTTLFWNVALKRQQSVFT